MFLQPQWIIQAGSVSMGVSSVLRYLKMLVKLGYCTVLKGKRPTTFSSVPTIWQKVWDNVREEDEKPLWSSVAFSVKLPTLPPYTEGWIIVSDRGIYFSCIFRNRPKFLYRRRTSPCWKWYNFKIVALVSFILEGEEWQLFLPKKENLFRSRLFAFEAR